MISTCKNLFPLIVRRHEMNMSASFSVCIALKPAFSQLNYFIFKFSSRVRDNSFFCYFFLNLTKKQAVKLTRYESKSTNKIKALLSSFVGWFSICIGFH